MADDTGKEGTADKRFERLEASHADLAKKLDTLITAQENSWTKTRAGLIEDVKAEIKRIETEIVKLAERDNERKRTHGEETEDGDDNPFTDFLFGSRRNPDRSGGGNA